MNDTGANCIALFDFDHTIINKDSTGEFIPFAIRRDKWRVVLLILARPLIFLLSLSKRTRWRRNWLYYQIAVVGLDEERMNEVKQGFFEHFFYYRKARVYKQALEKIRQHLRQGHKVVIISGSLQWLLEDLCRRLNIRDVSIYGSSKAFFCFETNKVVKIKQSEKLQDYDAIYGYSDSAADIPMLSLCDEITLVNPTASCKEKFIHAFGDKPNVVSWHG